MKRMLLLSIACTFPYVMHGSQTQVQSEAAIKLVDIARLEQEAEEEAQEIDKLQKDDTNSENYLFWGTHYYLDQAPESVTPVLAATPQLEKEKEEATITPNASPCKERISCIAHFAELGCCFTTAAVALAGALIQCFNASTLHSKNSYSDYSD